MQGQQLKFDLDCNEMQRHVEAIHKENSDGYIALCTRPIYGEFKQRHYIYNDLIKALDIASLETSRIDENTDCYFSVNTFYIPKRLLENVRHIRALYADIDCHHLTPAKVKRVIEDVIICFSMPIMKKHIPVPSIDVRTGRGLQLYWLLEDLPNKAIPFWQVMQDLITERLRQMVEHFKLDVKVDNVSDIARVLRLSGTNNTKASQIARLNIMSTKKYRLDELRDEYFPELKKLDKPKNEKSTQSKEYGRIHHIFNLYSLHYTRLMDLTKLLELRKGRIDSDECRRRMVFLYRYWNCCYLQDTLRACEITLLFNKGFTTPLPEKTVIRETESAEKAYYDWKSGETVNINGQAYRKGYNYKNATLIRWLDITPEEQRELKTIIGTEEKYRRKNEARNKSRYGKDESGLTAKQRQREERDQHILEMHERGLSNRKIGELVKMSESGVRKALLRVRTF